MQSNATLNKPSQFTYFMCSSSNTPGETNEALDQFHQMCLRQHLFCRYVILWGILFRGLNHFETGEVIKSCIFSSIWRNHT